MVGDSEVLAKTASEKKPADTTLEELLEGVPDDGIGEIDWGSPQGAEMW